MRFFLLTLVCVLAGPAMAQDAPITLTYQGSLSDAGGQPINGVRAITFRLYEQREGGDALWTEVHGEADVVDGVFTSVLGFRTVFDAGVMGAEALFLGVQIGDEVETTPRMRVGGALKAQWAAMAAHAKDVRGEDIHPASVSIGDREVINAAGEWVGPEVGIVGPPGPEGPQGGRGLQGLEGPAGSQGPRGPQGLEGPAGPQGLVGADGPQGPRGSQGIEGPQGPRGVAGEVGPQGPAGPPGPAGPAGPAGAVGSEGQPGAQGSAGPAGEQGQPGLEGEMGPQGEPGPAGAEGPAGPQGVVGERGPAGVDGAIGPEGPAGAAGPQGPPGVAGPVGPAGADGAQGTPGPAGPPGPGAESPLTNLFPEQPRTEGEALEIPRSLEIGVEMPLLLDYSGVVTGIEVWVDITHPDLTKLVLTLLAPDGRSYALFDGDSGLRAGANLNVTFPTELVTEEPLDPIFDPATPVRGQWVLRAVDSDGANPDAERRINAWGLNLTRRADDAWRLPMDLVVEGAVTSETSCRIRQLIQDGEPVPGAITLTCGDQDPVRLTTFQCGNGEIDPAETCDDGNFDGGDGCDARCLLECGNGRQDPGEECDDGNLAANDNCTDSCLNADCGDGIIWLGNEVCDLGAANSDEPGADCRLDCTAQSCGDGIQDPGEGCDDGNDVNNDACTNACVPARCGDGIIGPGEVCDDGNNDDGDFCSAQCAASPFVMTPCGSTGRNGPNQEDCNNAYGANRVVVQDGIQSFTIPSDGVYLLEAAGALGGGNGGRGAIMRGEFAFTAGTVLRVLVGQRGGSNTDSAGCDSGGGGGTFVVDAFGEAILVAGGGGGSSQGGSGRSGTSESAGTAGDGGNAGGINGNGGQRAHGTSGGGLLTDGDNGTWGGPPPGGGQAFVNGGRGGAEQNFGAWGGFGGGSGGHGNCCIGGGAGGGYSGGGGAASCQPGGGGGSINTGDNQVNASGQNDGQGRLSIQPL